MTDTLLCKYKPNKCSCQVPRTNELKQVWGDWVDEVGMRKGGWDWFTTLTFRDRTAEEQALGWTKVGWAYSKRACNEFLGHLGDLKGLNDLWWVRCREIQAWRGVPHWHLFVGGVAGLRRLDLVDWWHDKGYGFARVMPYERELGGRFYLCKYLTKELGDIEFSRNLTRVDRCVNLINTK